MPTGYTAGIIDGNIKTFRDFAKICMRAFGATVHMKDESLDKEYEIRKVDSYYKENLNSKESELIETKARSIEEIVEARKKVIEEDIERYTVKIKKMTLDKKKFDEILSDVNKWEPPTEDHIEFKKFMQTQIIDAIKYDCDIDYYSKKKAELEAAYKSDINASIIKNEEINSIKKDIEYYKERLISQEESANESNKWVEALFESINEFKGAKK